MEIILLRDVQNLGITGSIIKVSEGYARNFLIPRGLAAVTSAANLKRIEEENKIKEQKLQKEKKQLQELADKINGTSCTVAVETNVNEKLYGSVTAIDIAKALEVEGFKIDKKYIILDAPIEDLGIFDVEIRLHPEVTAKIRLWVTKK